MGNDRGYQITLCYTLYHFLSKKIAHFVYNSKEPLVRCMEWLLNVYRGSWEKFKMEIGGSEKKFKYGGRAAVRNPPYFDNHLTLMVSVIKCYIIDIIIVASGISTRLNLWAEVLVPVCACGHGVLNLYATHMRCVTRKQTLRSLSLSCQKKDWPAWTPTFREYDLWSQKTLKSRCHTSFGVTMTKTLRSDFLWRASYLNVLCNACEH